MSTAIWGESPSQAEEIYSPSLLKHLLQQMMMQCSATGACLALYNEHFRQMEIRQHVRLRNSHPEPEPDILHKDGTYPAARSNNGLPHDTSPSGRLRRPAPLLALDELEEVSPQQSQLFPVGALYPPGEDLIGQVWRENEAYVMSHELYLSLFHANHREQVEADITPTCYLAIPLREPSLASELQGRNKQSQLSGMLGVVILYQTAPGAKFIHWQRLEALSFAERFALYLQNEQLRYHQRRSSEYLRQLQDISAVFPSTVQLSTLVEKAYQFAQSVVDVSSMLITLYDRDRKKIYDVFAVNGGQRLEQVEQRPPIFLPEERPLWWRVTHDEKRTLLLEPISQERGDYDELLTGSWGDQRKAGTFLLLPMKMFNRVTGSLCLTSTLTNAYRPEEIQVLETMVQIITVSIENAKLYHRDSRLLREARQREELLATVNSALLSISFVLNVSELLHKFVEAVTRLVQAEMSIIFLLSEDKAQLVAQAAYAPPGDQKNDSEDPLVQWYKDKTHDELIEKIHIPFKGTLLERLAGDAFFYLDQSTAEELAQESDEGGAIFLRETDIQKMLMIPVLYQTELVGILGVHTPRQNHIFQPTEIGMLQALCAQAASAIRNAQLFEELQEKNAELQRMNTLKDEFLVTASHELRTPLTAITGYSTLLKRQSNRITPPQILRLATKISGAAQQLADLLSSISEAAKVGTVDKKLDLQIGSVKLLSAVEMAVGLLSVNIEQQIVTDVTPDLWVRGDPLRVRQVISNLLDNAAKYSPPDGQIELVAHQTILSDLPLPDDLKDVESDPNLPVVYVSVRDQGEGIAPEDRERIFEKFVRASRSLTTPVRGTGLGLFICRRYIEAMGGKLWLQQSNPGEGSTFSFYLPRGEALIETQEDEQDNQEQKQQEQDQREPVQQ